MLGMTRRQIFFRVTLLQMVKRVVPPMSNEIITLVKDTSLANTIGVVELIRSGETFRTNGGLIWPFFYTAVFYLVFVGALTILFNLLEKKLTLLPGVRGGEDHGDFTSGEHPEAVLERSPCSGTSALTWSGARPWPSSAPPAPARPLLCCGA